MNKVYIVGVGVSAEQLEEARILAEQEGKELVILDNASELPRKSEFTLTAPPILNPVQFESNRGYDNRTSRKNKGRNKKNYF